MQLECIKCKKLRTLSEEEINETSEFILKKGMKAMSILRYWNMADGDTCDGREHRYGFNKDFLTNVLEKINNIKETEEKFLKNHNEIKEISNKVVELQTRMFDLQNENEHLQNESKEKQEEILKITGLGTNKWE